MSKLTKGTYKLRPEFVCEGNPPQTDWQLIAAKPSTSKLRTAYRRALFGAIRYAYKLQDMFDLNDDGSIPELPKFDGSIHSKLPRQRTAHRGAGWRALYRCTR